MPAPAYLPHIIYATALVSLALNLLSTRKEGAAARQRAEARISLLDGLTRRLRSGERVSGDEIARIRRLLKEEESKESPLGKDNEAGSAGRASAVNGGK